MAERTTSREEAEFLRRSLNEAIGELESLGFTRSQIGASMVGIGAALVAVNDSPSNACLIMSGVRDVLLSRSYS